MNANDVTIVTGGGRGIGRAISQRMARETAVLLIGQNREHLESAVAEIRDSGGRADFVQGDVSDRKTAATALAKAAERGWKIRNVVCNAGIGKGGAAQDFDDEMFIRMFEVNVFGTWWFIKACLPQMIEQKRGAICLISSIVAVKPYKYDAPYCATKGALNAMAGSLAHETAKHGLIVVPLCPSFVESEMTDRSIAGLAKHRNISLEAARAKIAEACPGGRILPAEELADHVAYICSGANKRLSGKPYMLPRKLPRGKRGGSQK